MKKYTETEVPARVERRHTSTVCDLCGDETTTEWAPGHSASETEVRIRDGSSYPEGGSGTEIKYDICPKCFRGKLIPWLESQGAKTEVTEWGW